MFDKPSIRTAPSINLAVSETAPFRSRVLVSLLLFKVSWGLLVIFQNAALLPVALLQLTSLVLHPARMRAWQPALLCAASGMLMDQALSLGGILVFPTALVPAWLLLLWLAWGLALTFGLRFLHKLPTWALALLGSCAGAGSYGAGHLLGAVDFGLANGSVLLILALLWALVLPLQIRLVLQLSGVRS